MVSISNLLTLAAVGTAILGFYKLGGASGIGSKLGGGVSGLFDSFTNSILPNTQTNSPDNQGGFNYDNTGSGGGGSQDIPLDQYPATDNEGNPLIPTIPIDDIDQSAFFRPLQDRAVSKGFAEKYSFQAPPTDGRLNVSKNFQYINSPTYRAVVSQGQHSSPFGGYTSADDQRNELQRQIEINATKYPEWFA
jgi:hypothetical protein